MCGGGGGEGIREVEGKRGRRGGGVTWRVRGGRRGVCDRECDKGHDRVCCKGLIGCVVMLSPCCCCSCTVAM